jgi:hypothetical protein
MKKTFMKFSVIYLIVYVLVLVMPGLVVHPVDWFAEMITGIHYVDGWTHGFMAYTVLAVLMPIVYIITLAVYWFRKQNSSKDNNDSNVDNHC